VTATVTAGFTLAGGLTLGSMVPSYNSGVTATVSSGLTMAGVIGINATPSMEFGNAVIAAAPLELPLMVGGLTITGTPVIGFDADAGIGFYWAGRYWNAHYWAPYYWQTQIECIAEVTAGLSMAGGISLDFDPEQILEETIQNTLTMDGVLTIEGTPEFEVPPEVPVVEPEIGSYGMRPRKKPKRKKEEIEDAVLVVEKPKPYRVPKPGSSLDDLYKAKPPKPKAELKKKEEEERKRKKKAELLLL